MEDNEIANFSMRIAKSKLLLAKYNIHNFLNRPSTAWSKVYHLITFSLIFISLIVSVYPENADSFDEVNILKTLEAILLIWFGTEFSLNFWASDCRACYRGWWGKGKYLLDPSHLAELVVIGVSIAISIVDQHKGYEIFAFQVIRGFSRLLLVIQIITLRRQVNPWRLLFSVVYDQRKQLILMVYLELMLITTLAHICYLGEHQTNKQISNIFEALCWAIETLSTTGYGNKVPESQFVKFVTSGYIVLSVSVFVLQGTVIGAGLALKAKEFEKDKLLQDKKLKAAIVIQWAWRFHWSTQIQHSMRNNFGFVFRSKSLSVLRDCMTKQMATIFINKTNLHLAADEFRQLRRPLYLTNIIEAQKFEKAQIEHKLESLSFRIECFINKVTKSQIEEAEHKHLKIRICQLEMHIFNMNQNDFVEEEKIKEYSFHNRLTRERSISF